MTHCHLFYIALSLYICLNNNKQISNIMEITLKFNNEIKTYPTIKDAKKFLNEADYYCERVELLYSFEDAIIYNNKTILSDLQRETNVYGEGWITVFQIFE